MSCKKCEYSPKTYEEYCIGQKNPSIYCPDAYTEKSHLCGNFGKEGTPQKNEDNKMTLDEAITHAEEVAEKKDKEAYSWEYEYDGNVPNTISECKKRAEEYRQLAKWLKDYKRLLELPDKLDEIITKQIDISNNQWVLDVMSEINIETSQGWIPVSKGLPKAGEYVGNVAKYYLVQNEYGDMLVARYTHNEYWEQIYQHRVYADKIVAWMPLPEPYEPQESEVEK